MRRSAVAEHVGDAAEHLLGAPERDAPHQVHADRHVLLHLGRRLSRDCPGERGWTRSPGSVLPASASVRPHGAARDLRRPFGELSEPRVLARAGRRDRGGGLRRLLPLGPPRLRAVADVADPGSRWRRSRRDRAGADRPAGHADAAPAGREARARDGHARPAERRAARARRRIGGDRHGEFGPFGDERDPRERARALDADLARLVELWDGEFQPVPVQQPRIPVWVAARWPNRRPVRRAARWDGVFPVELPGPEALAELVAEVRADRDGAALRLRDHPAARHRLRPVGGGGRDVVPHRLRLDPREAEVREAIEAGP